MLKLIGQTAGRLYEKVTRSKSSNQRSRTPTPLKTKPQPQKDRVEKQTNYFDCTKLPPNFADDLLNYEVEIEEGHYTHKNIGTLMELYAMAIKHYEGTMSSKVYAYQNKMKNLLENIEVKKILQENKKTEGTLTPRQKIENFNQELMNKSNKDVPVRKIIEAHTKKINDVENIFSGQIISQEDKILQRLEERKKNAMRSKSQASASVTEEAEKTPKFTKLAKGGFSLFTPFNEDKAMFERENTEGSPQKHRLLDKIAKIKTKITEEEEKKCQNLSISTENYGRPMSQTRENNFLSKIMDFPNREQYSVTREEEKNQININNIGSTETDKGRNFTSSNGKNSSLGFKIIKKKQ